MCVFDVNFPFFFFFFSFLFVVPTTHRRMRFKTRHVRRPCDRVSATRGVRDIRGAQDLFVAAIAVYPFMSHYTGEWRTAYYTTRTVNA